MPLLQQFCQLLYDSSFGTMVRESNNAFPIIESIHVLSITLLVGSIAILDLRMLGLVLRSIPVTRIARGVLPLTWSGFTVSFVSGFLLFWAEAAKNYSNPAFRVKLVPLALVGLNGSSSTLRSTVASMNGRLLRVLHGGLESRGSP